MSEEKTTATLTDYLGCLAVAASVVAGIVLLSVVSEGIGTAVNEHLGTVAISAIVLFVGVNWWRGQRARGKL